MIAIPAPLLAVGVIVGGVLLLCFALVAYILHTAPYGSETERGYKSEPKP
jgi:hypothetical protein